MAVAAIGAETDIPVEPVSHAIFAAITATIHGAQWFHRRHRCNRLAPAPLILRLLRLAMMRTLVNRGGWSEHG